MIQLKLLLPLKIRNKKICLQLNPPANLQTASDDLRAAYDYLRQYGIDPQRKTAPPTRIGLYAESSGGALAVALVQSLRAAGEPVPCCLGLNSPWLDLSCEGGSHIVNEAFDLMMRKDRLQGIASAYLAGTTEATDPRASPLHAPEGGNLGAFLMPPTLIHVCKNELLLDDSLVFGEYCHGAGSEVTVKSFDQALHGWHTYFPLMPVAEQALVEMATFLRPHLRDDAREAADTADASNAAPPP